ncbi:MAG: hypothetical protein ACLPKT_06940 [Methylocella sp.]
MDSVLVGEGFEVFKDYRDKVRALDEIVIMRLRSALGVSPRVFTWRRISFGIILDVHGEV